MTTTKQPIPDGFMENADGHLVRKDRIASIDIQRDALVKGLCADAQALQDMMREFRTKAFAAMHAFLDEMFLGHGVKRSDKLGNHIVYSYDGQYKIVMQRGSKAELSEQFPVAEQLLLELIEEWTRPNTEDLVAIIKNALTRKNGQLDVIKLLELRKIEGIKHPKWASAMEIIGNSLSRLYTKQYVRFYRRQEDGSYAAIVLDFASL